MRTSTALIALSLLAAPAGAQASVLVVGDSLEVGTGPYLKRELRGQSVTIDAATGRPSPAGVGVLRARIAPGEDIVVFDLGTNDDPGAPGVLAGDLAAARKIAGRRCMVVATVSRPPLGGKSVDGLNQAVESFVSGDHDARLVDWHAETQQDPSLLAGDGVHPGPDGYARRAELVAEGVRSCGRGSTAAADKSFPTRGPKLGGDSGGKRHSRPARLDLGALAGLLPVRPAGFAMREIAGAFSFAASGVVTGLLRLRAQPPG